MDKSQATLQFGLKFALPGERLPRQTRLIPDRAFLSVVCRPLLWRADSSPGLLPRRSASWAAPQRLLSLHRPFAMSPGNRWMGGPDQWQSGPPSGSQPVGLRPEQHENGYPRGQYSWGPVGPGISVGGEEQPERRFDRESTDWARGERGFSGGRLWRLRQ